jgi:hypothetical protein
MSGAADTANDVRELSAMVDAARALVAAGDLVDLDGLDARVTRIIEQLRSVPAPERMDVKPALIALIDAFGALERTIAEKRDATARELGNLAARRRALTAYGTPGGGVKDR